MLSHDQRNNDQMFPKLDAAQIERLSSYGARRHAEAGEILFDQGDVGRGSKVIISGRVEIVDPTAAGETLITAHGPGELTGEVSILAGRRSLVRGRVTEPTELLEISRANLLRIIQTDPELSEIFLRA